MRFADLFLTREYWKAEHFKPYLSNIAVDTKDFDKILLKYARALLDEDGSWYTEQALEELEKEHTVLPCSHPILQYIANDISTTKLYFCTCVYKMRHNRLRQDGKMT